MKKFALLLLAAAMVVMTSCKNAQNSEENSQEVSLQEQYLTEDLKIQVQGLAESLQNLKHFPGINIFREDSVTKFELTPKQKMLKPDFLLAPNVADNLVNLTQKYRAVGMLSVDYTTAQLYDMPVDEYKAALTKLDTDINDPAFKALGEDTFNSIDIMAFYDAEVEAGRTNFFWEIIAASAVEQVYIMTQKMDLFLPAFDDKTASDVTYRFILVQEGIKALIPYHPEMESLNEVLEPLYVLNAINVEQLMNQLVELKGEIEVARQKLLE
ncbi:MAG: hypothetical protein KBS89_04120 [Bacteroidales bacterium]|nr:hypothetical protein [Candidatus Egerieousia equi]